MSYLVLARKWRPKRFVELLGQEPIVRIFKNAISQGKIAHAYLFSGPRGIGKTSTARILSKAMNCKEGPTPSPCGICQSCTGITEGSSVDVIEIDGASNNSVDDIRDLRERVKYAPSSSKYKVYIIDEVHMLSGSAFNALLKTLEEPPSHIIFVLATTALKKIPATILSRCQHMPFRRISSKEIRSRLREISESEGIIITPSALNLIARAADGSMRDSLTILDQLSSFSSEITDENVKSLLGIADISIFRDLLVASVMVNPEDVLDLSSEEMSVARDIISASTEDQLTLMLSEIMKAETDVRNSSSPRLALEMSLIRASFLSTMKPIKEVIENIKNIKKYQKHFAGQIPDIAVEKKQAEEQTVNIPPEAKRSETQHADGRKPEKPVNGTIHDKSFDEQSPNEHSTNAENSVSSLWEKTLERVDTPLASKISKADVELKGNDLFLTLNGACCI
jgi:DNA polymerase-3 subunit gamma/tau